MPQVPPPPPDTSLPPTPPVTGWPGQCLGHAKSLSSCHDGHSVLLHFQQLEGYKHATILCAAGACTHYQCPPPPQLPPHAASAPDKETVMLVQTGHLNQPASDFATVHVITVGHGCFWVEAPPPPPPPASLL
jgi:hypothetical protein